MSTRRKSRGRKRKASSQDVIGEERTRKKRKRSVDPTPPKLLIKFPPSPKVESRGRRKKRRRDKDGDYVPVRGNTLKPYRDSHPTMQAMTDPMKRAYQLTRNMMKMQDANVFCYPVDAKGGGCENYYKVIKEPMDFGAITQKMIQKEYKSIHEWAFDVRLIFHNCFLYNNKGDWVYKAGMLLKRHFERVWKKELIKNSEESAYRDMPKRLKRAFPKKKAKKKKKLSPDDTACVFSMTPKQKVKMMNKMKDDFDDREWGRVVRMVKGLECPDKEINKQFTINLDRINPRTLEMLYYYVYEHEE